MNIMLEATGLHASYHIGGMPQPILRDVNLVINRGEFVAVMGASGCGKSTLLYNASGLDRPTEGQVSFDGKQLETLGETALSALRLNYMGFVFQQSNLMKNLSILDNIVLAGYLAKRESRRSINKRAVNLMKHLDIAKLANRDITQVSGGQLQRAAICRALINNPKMLFGDEPTGALNASATEDVMKIFADIHESGTTILLATHDPKLAARCQRVIYMSDGRIVAECSLATWEKGKKTIEREKMLADWLLAQGF